MAKRIFSTVLLWAIVIAALRFFGAQGAIWLIALLGIATQHEFYQLLIKMGHKPFHKLGLFLGALLLLAPYYLTRFAVVDGAQAADFSEAIIAAAVLICCLRVLSERDASTRVETLSATLFGLIYVPFLLQFLARIIMLSPETNEGLVLCLWLVAVAKFCDVGALLTGMAFGKNKMAPNISPKKTWEGALGGVLCSAAIGAGAVWAGADYFPESFTPVIAALCAVPIAATAILSDLIESIIKRRADLKDTGGLIPGIGGIFDLTDSLILAAPLGYLIFCVLP